MRAKDPDGVFSPCSSQAACCGKMIDGVQVLAQVGDEGQGMGKGAEIIHPLHVARRDQGGEAVRRGAERISQIEEMPFEIIDQAGEQRAQGEDTAGFLADLAAGAARPWGRLVGYRAV